ncbi:hypothetical protein C3O68_02564 [Pseudomonas aeruginosa]|nr:hypothetical protein [Pseudomonas aeruginosa]OXT72026.1 hypothetical protein CF345_05575 [Pseudomonas aeruginosa]RCN07239.1 hypothetical protein C3O68_02564 [Pseudomonas aeruginosa]RPO02303.1 hypothetical protein IPC1235_21340 [Pseudomonas aeruginosa]
MARRHPGLPVAESVIFSKADLLQQLQAVDLDHDSRARTLRMEEYFRQRIDLHVGSLVSNDACFEKFYTSPFVLLMHARKNNYTRVSEIEHDILPAKLFSSMETSAGRAVELVALPVYDWHPVLSEMHSANSALDGLKLVDNTLKVATLKSGPRCLNDEMSENFADAIIANLEAWASSHRVRRVEFTYGVLYGTQRKSNKKDWHIFKNLELKLGSSRFSISPQRRWDCSFSYKDIEVQAGIRIGKDWWRYLGGDLGLVELAVAIIRACIPPGNADPANQHYTIQDLHSIVTLENIPEGFNPAILQRSQISWYFFFMRHFCDSMVE